MHPNAAEPPTRDEITAAEQANDERMLRLTQQHKVQFDAGAIMQVKLDHLLTGLFGGPDDPRRRAFDASLVARFSALLDDTEVSVRKAVLQQGVPGVAPQQLIVP